jgi:hypothetical protein
MFINEVLHIHATIESLITARTFTTSYEITDDDTCHHWLIA